MRQHRLLFLSIFLLPLGYIPHELLRSGPNLTYELFALGLLVAVKYRPLRGQIAMVDGITIALIVYVGARDTVLAKLDDEPINWSFAAREVGALFLGWILYRLARLPDLKGTILKALRYGLVVMLAVEAYQQVIGLPHLIGLGYQYPEFNYYTRSGSYRPFGTFKSPTVFGAYLAMTGVFVMIATERKVWRWAATVIPGLLLTSTRSAWLGFCLAFIPAVGVADQRWRRRLIPGGFIAFLTVSIGSLLAPSTAGSIMSRAASISNENLDSNASRLTLWGSVIDLARRGHWLIGYGATDFATTAYPLIGSVAMLGHPHSNYMQELYRYGIIGLALFVLLLLTFARVLLQEAQSRYRAAALGALIVFAVDSIFNNSLSSLNFLSALFLLVGLGAGAAGSEPRSTQAAETGTLSPAGPRR